MLQRSRSTYAHLRYYMAGKDSNGSYGPSRMCLTSLWPGCSMIWMRQKFKVGQHIQVIFLKGKEHMCEDFGRRMIEPSRNLLSQYHPIVRLSSPRTKKTKEVLVPESFTSQVLCTTLDFEDWATNWHEWISLIVLGSARIHRNDQIDPFLCHPIVSGTNTSVSSIVLLEWCGLLPSRWIRSMFIELWYVDNHFNLIRVQASFTERGFTLIQLYSALSAKTKVSRANTWFSLSAHAFHGQVYDGQDGYTILWVPEGLKDTSDGHHGAESGEEKAFQPVKHDYVLWEFSKVHHITG